MRAGQPYQAMQPLSAELVAEAQAWYRVGGWNQQEIADAFGVSKRRLADHLNIAERGAPTARMRGARNVGALNGHAVLTAEAVAEMRGFHEAGWRGSVLCRVYSECYGVSVKSCESALRRQTWRSVA
jgi:hypothetical protein